MERFAEGAEDLRWFKSRHSGSDGGDCVEVAECGSGAVYVRDSKAVGMGGAVLRVRRDVWAAFVRVVAAD